MLFLNHNIKSPRGNIDFVSLFLYALVRLSPPLISLPSRVKYAKNKHCRVVPGRAG